MYNAIERKANGKNTEEQEQNKPYFFYQSNK